MKQISCLDCANAKKSFDLEINNLSELLKVQSTVLFGEVKNETRHLPLIVYKILGHLKKEIENGKLTSECLINSFYNFDCPKTYEKKWNDVRSQMPELKVLYRKIN